MCAPAGGACYYSKQRQMRKNTARCPHCNKLVTVGSNMSIGTYRCPHCNREVRFVGRR